MLYSGVHTHSMSPLVNTHLMFLLLDYYQTACVLYCVASTCRTVCHDSDGVCTLTNWLCFALLMIDAKNTSGEIMEFEHKQKQTLSPLQDEGLLLQVFTFLPGHHLFISAVCKDWKAVYASMADQQVRSFTLYDDDPEFVTCGARSTLYSAVLHRLQQSAWRDVVV
jgi:hypothetical protein